MQQLFEEELRALEKKVSPKSLVFDNGPVDHDRRWLLLYWVE